MASIAMPSRAALTFSDEVLNARFTFVPPRDGGMIAKSYWKVHGFDASESGRSTRECAAGPVHRAGRSSDHERDMRRLVTPVCDDWLTGCTGAAKGGSTGTAPGTALIVGADGDENDEAITTCAG